MSAIQIFSNPQFGAVRVLEINGEPLFCLADLCKVLELTNPSSVRSRLDESDVQVIDLHALNHEMVGNSMANFVNESGFYEVILQSSSQKVRPFKKWITREVLPSIRKHGGYIASNQEDTPELIMARALQVAQATLERHKLQLEQVNNTIREQSPKVLFADAVATSDRSILVAELAKILNQNGINIGQNRLFIWLRENGYLCSKGDYYNHPTQRAMDLGLFEVKKTAINKPDGTVLTTSTTKVTGKGQVYFVNKFLKNNAA